MPKQALHARMNTRTMAGDWPVTCGRNGRVGAGASRAEWNAQWTDEQTRTQKNYLQRQINSLCGLTR